MSAGAFRCGHPKTPVNMKIGYNGVAACRQCQCDKESARRKANRAELTPAERYLDHRLKYLPRQIDGARRKLAALEAEARRYGMTDLLP